MSLAKKGRCDIFLICSTVFFVSQGDQRIFVNSCFVRVMFKNDMVTEESFFTCLVQKSDWESGPMFKSQVSKDRRGILFLKVSRGKHTENKN